MDSSTNSVQEQNIATEGAVSESVHPEIVKHVDEGASLTKANDTSKADSDSDDLLIVDEGQNVSFLNFLSSKNFFFFGMQKIWHCCCSRFRYELVMVAMMALTCLWYWNQNIGGGGHSRNSHFVYAVCTD